MNSHATGVELDVLHTAEIPTPYNYVFRSDGNRLAQLRAGLNKKGRLVQSPCLAYVVRHRDLGVVLIDTGFHPQASTDLGKDFGLVMSRLFSDLRPAELSFAAQLKRLGVDAGEVEHVVMTHLHVDHTSGMRVLPNATFTCTGDEWRAAHSRFAVANGYVRHHLPPTSRVQLLDYDTHGEPYDAFERTIDLAGDGSIRLISTPGHTRGHQSVLLRLADGRTALLVGDAAYTRRSIREELLPMLTADDSKSLRTLRGLNSFAHRHPEAVLVPSHDPDAWHELNASPLCPGPE